jgi:hypothetical protein
MEQWQKDLAAIVSTVADEVERFFLGMGEIMDVLWEVTEDITEQLQNTIATDLDQCLEELNDPVLEVYWEIEDIVGDTETAFPYGVEPTTETNPACMGCQHYHGQVYSDNLLVCAMHPHGWHDSHCPDWEKV